MTLPVVTRQDEAAFLELLCDLGKIGAVEGGGVCRLAASPADGKARDFLARQFAQLGAMQSVDVIGNQFGRMPFGAGQGAVLCGSHLDTQPTGGRYDGALGIAAAVMAARILARHSTAARYRHDLVLCNWTNEEGARFTPSLTGSSAFVGNLELETANRLRDGAGVTLGDALAAIGYAGKDTGPRDAVAAVELHIEQGSVLEQTGAMIGIVERNWAARKLCLCFRGEPSHTGPTAKPLRKDALLAAARFVGLAHDLANAHPADPILAIARIENGPNSANVISCETRIWVEIRHPDMDVCAALGAEVLEMGNSQRVLGGGAR